MDVKPTFTLGESIENRLNAQKMDVSANFLNGVETSPYNPKNIGAQAEAQWDQVTGQVTQSWQNLENNWDATIDAWENVNLKKEIFDKIWDYIKNDIEAYAQYKLDEFIQETASLTVWGAERVVYWTAYYTKQKIDEAIEALYKDTNKENEQKQQDAEKASMQEKIQNTLAKAQDIKKIVVDVTATTYLAVEEITSVMSAGPEYIVSNTNKLYDKTVTPLKKELDNLTFKGIQEARKYVDKGAEAMGKWLADKTAKAVQKATSYVINKAKQAKATAKSAAAAAEKWAENQLKSKTGA